MLATTWPRPFSDPEWSFEVKWDGVRVLLYWDGEKVELRSRRGRDVTAIYPELARFTAPRSCVLDGEVVAFDEGGRPSFQALQSRMNLTGPLRISTQARAVPISYLVFDLLYDGEEVAALPLELRRERLDELPLELPCVRSVAVPGDGEAFFHAATARGLEGVVAKRLASPYRSGVRSSEWRKLSGVKTTRAVVAGYTPGEGGRAGTFGALLLGLWEGELLRFVGAVGTGFDQPTLVVIRRTLEELGRRSSPFHPGDPLFPKRANFVEPQLVAMVEFKEWTSAGKLRAPSFKGFTDDPVGSMTWENEGP